MKLHQYVALGFDGSTRKPGGIIRIRCSQCEVTIINGVAVHERGCPNERHECLGCMTFVERGVRWCEDCAS